MDWLEANPEPQVDSPHGGALGNGLDCTSVVMGGYQSLPRRGVTVGFRLFVILSGCATPDVPNLPITLTL